LPSLSGEALREQQARLNHLLSEASKQQEAFKRANPIRSGKEHARLVVAGIITFPGIWHKFSISNNKVPGPRCSIKEEASRDIGKMMEILPLRGQDTSNLGSNNISRTSSMSNTSKTSRRSSSKT
jgi:hypothetical protein